MATTPLFALVYPTTANQITPLATQFANIATSAETAIATQQSRVFGLDSARTALVAPQRKEGVEFYSTDTKREWKYDGTNWAINDNGSYSIYPTSVVGGVIQPDGSVTPNAVSTLSFNGVFTGRFRRYRLEFSYSTNVASGSTIQWRNSGVDKADANFYSWAQQATNGNGATGALSSGTAQSVALMAASYHSGYVEFTNPAQTSTPKYISTLDITAPQTGFCATGGWSSNDNGTYDGFTFGVGGSAFSTSSYCRFKLYAYA